MLGRLALEIREKFPKLRISRSWPGIFAYRTITTSTLVWRIETAGYRPECTGMPDPRNSVRLGYPFLVCTREALTFSEAQNLVMQSSERAKTVILPLELIRARLRVIIGHG